MQSLLSQSNTSTSTMNQVQLESDSSIFGEDEAHAHLLKQLSDRPPLNNLRTSSQHNIRSIINSILAPSLKEVISLRDRARLNNIATIHAGAWLWALPNPNLGLATSPHEFVIAIWIWLGIPLFPFPPSSLKCVCVKFLTLLKIIWLAAVTFLSGSNTMTPFAK